MHSPVRPHPIHHFALTKFREATTVNCVWGALLGAFLLGTAGLPSAAVDSADAVRMAPTEMPEDFRPVIRVGLIPNARSCLLFSMSQVRITSGQDSVGHAWKGTIHAGVVGDSLMLRDSRKNEFKSADSIWVRPLNRYNFVEVNSQTFRGHILLLKAEGERLTLVNELAIEDYLRGVVPFEIGHHGIEKLEALKAQAVAARTYTISRMFAKPDDRPFHVFADVSDQVYKGRSGEYLMADRAIRETRGVVAASDSGLVECYYSSTCGGRTSTVDEVWVDKPARPYLASQSDMAKGKALCAKSKYLIWKQEWSFAQLNRILKRFLPLVDSTAVGCGNLRSIKIAKRTTSGRIAELAIKTQKGDYTVRGDKVRWVLRRPGKGNPILRSAWFDLRKRPRLGKPKRYIAVGRGWGHGVGMCQMGALGSAEQNYPYDRILKHYYKGIRLAKWEY